MAGKKSPEPTPEVEHPGIPALDLTFAQLKSVLGDRLEVACINPKLIAGTGGSIMIPANEPCPVEPHNHDKSLRSKVFEKVLIIKPER